MNTFASGPKRSYYGKGDVIAYRLHRDGNHAAGENPVFGANVKILIYGDAFWPTYTTGDNTGLIATDSMKNFVQRETMNFPGYDLESYCQFLAEKFLAKYPQVEGAQLSAVSIPYEPLGGAVTYAPGGPDRAFASIELTRDGSATTRSGITGFRLLRLNGSAFKGFVRDEYTTLPDITNRPLNMWLDLDWTYTSNEAAFGGGAVTKQVRKIVHDVFAGFASGSIQQIIYQMGEKMLAEIPAISEIHLEGNNRTWDTISEQGDSLGIYTDARPPYGCLGLTMKR
ncbi:MAG: urate oxidase / 2-oxo-4-hydroxy-4-carboxy-5-ureidoimidazoline decarboxylase [Bryobacterales bacterium]|jgi:urate oxidase|nr:urate oxidase / 2-oxo-4-hydroxy-4-carboxy-5-ureidoimidazoline decarboxylase [Bryobacterales bacterium]